MAKFALPTRRPLLVGLLLTVFGCTACTSQGAKPAIRDVRNASAPTTTASSSGATTTSEVTQSTSDYDPGYDTIGQLVRDSEFIVIGTLGSEISSTDGSGHPITAYPIVVERTLGTNTRASGIGISAQLFTVAGLQLGRPYVFFWAADPSDRKACVTGGVRGVMAYDPTSQEVTRLDNNPGSQIPRSETLDELGAAIQAAVVQSTPRSTQPPVCAQSATGLAPW
jgi:hypothetical protein